MKVQSLSHWAKENDYSYRGAYNRFVKGNIKGAYTTETGRIVVPVEDNDPIKTVVYARVSAHKQKKDLERQAERMTEFCIKNGWIVDQVITEIASGLNDKRPKLIKLLNRKEKLRIVSENKDRLTRFGLNYITTLINGEIVIANPTANDKEDLMQDLISLITSMVSRYYGQRRGSQKMKEIKEIIKQ